MVHIPIVYAMDDDYICAVIVSITSLALNAGLDTFYDVYILVDNNFSGKNEVERAVAGLGRKLEIQFINVGNRFQKAYLRYDFISRPTYFRLALPEMLNKEKCIYLDADTIICEDLQQLYETDISDKYIAGVKAPWFHIREDKDSYCKQAMLPSMKQYVNAGVLLLNLDEMRKFDLADKFMDYLKYDMECQDQDIINSCCYGKIAILPFQYNVMTKYGEWTLENYKGCFPEDELIDAWNNPSIIHYADRIKPWDSPDCCMGEFWWRECRNNSYAWAYYTRKYSIKFMVRTIFHVSPSGNGFTKILKLPRLFDLGAKRKLVLYGAGQRAEEFLAFLGADNIIPNRIIVKGLEGNPEKINNIEVVPLSDLDKQQTDTTLIIATREELQEEIMQDIKEFRFREIILLNDDWRYSL